MKRIIAPLILIYAITSLTAAFGQSYEPQNITIDFKNQEDLPIVLHQEMKINGETAEIKRFYTIRRSLDNFSCNQIISSSKTLNVWDYEVYLNNSLILKKWYVETSIEGDSSYVTTLPCIWLNTSGEILQQYKIKGIIKGINDSWLYPFDRYSINFSSEIGDYPELYSSKVIIPQNTYPIEDINFSYISGPFRKDIGSIVEKNIATGQETEKIKFFLFATKIRSPVLSSTEDQYYYLFPPLGLPSKNNTVKNRSEVMTVISWERPPLIKFLLIVSFVSILFLSILFLFKKYEISEYITYCFGIWAFQEGLNQLIPSIRPLTLTLFEYIIIIPFIIIILYLYIQYYYKRKLKINLEERL